MDGGGDGGGGDGGDPGARGPHRETRGEFAGWYTWQGYDAYESMLGPFYVKTVDGRPTCAFRAEPRHMNGGGFMHGGCMMSFADFALFALSRKALAGSHAVTVSLNGEFLGPASPGERVEATGEVTKAGRSLVFTRGLATAEGRPILSFPGVMTKVTPRVRDTPPA